MREVGEMKNAQEQGQFRSSRLVIADDHPLFRAAIRQMLGELPDLDVVGEAGDGREAVKLCQRLQPDLVLMDLRMPEMDGFEATREIRRESPSTVVLALTAFGEPESLLEALKAGASGYVLKDSSPQRIVGAIRRVLDGESPLNQEVAMELLGRMIEAQHQKEESTPKPSIHVALSAREVEVLE